MPGPASALMLTPASVGLSPGIPQHRLPNSLASFLAFDVRD